jgi:16S rRNA processing protein RimM
VTERFVVALVGAPFGLQGFVKIRSLSGEYDHIKRLDAVVLRLGDREGIWEVEKTCWVNQSLMMKFKGIDTPEAAKSLGGAEMLTDRDHAVPLKEHEFYVEDLQGLAVISISKASGGPPEVLGYITSIVEGGGGNLAEIRLNSGELKLVPFRKEFFGDINLETGRAELLETWILA